MHSFGLIRVAAATPSLRLADCEFNLNESLSMLRHAQSEAVDVVVFPELSLTGYTCNDLFSQRRLIESAAQALVTLAEHSSDVFEGLFVVGLPVAADDQLFNCAAVVAQGHVLGIVPKSYLPNYKEFYDARWFSPASTARSEALRLVDGSLVPFGANLLFECPDVPGLCLGVEICEDLWVPIPPSCHQAIYGATLLANLSASNEVIGKSTYRRQLVANQSGRCIAGYVYSAAGVNESTTDLVFGGHSIIAENGSILAESPRFRRDPQLLTADVDLQRLEYERRKTTTFASERREGSDVFQRIEFSLSNSADAMELRRVVDAHPFVPADDGQLHARCEEIFATQVSALARRLEQVSPPAISIGVSGGLDSTLALLVACKTLDTLGLPRSRLLAYTLPGFGTSSRTFNNAVSLMAQLGVTARQADIRALCLEQMRALPHRPFGIDLTGHTVETLTTALRQVPVDRRKDLVFENVQARMRTAILMNAGFVIGTGDVSELALGWATYNADHMSMYNPNVSIPKTLVKFLVRWVAHNEFEGPTREVLLDIVATEISPELLPPSESGEILQSTEQAVGPYELHDFFLYYFLRWGFEPAKILFLASFAKFDKPYTAEEIRKWLKVFIQRFFNNQFKRSCLPDGPKVGTVSVSPRGDWRMPSDAAAVAWLTDCEPHDD